jgi:glutaredoxin-like YruB-family protein
LGNVIGKINKNIMSNNKQSENSNGARKVVMYSTPSCHYCNLAKEFFDSHNIFYEVFDVQTNLEKRKEMVEVSGQMGVPVIFVGNEMIKGFDEDKLKELLDIKE